MGVAVMTRTWGSVGREAKASAFLFGDMKPDPEGSGYPDLLEAGAVVEGSGYPDFGGCLRMS
jgi:hypothetical protein